MARVLKYNEALLKIGQMIQNAQLQVGDRLPNEQEIASRLGMSIAPVRQALATLQSNAIIRKTPGVGTFYCGNIRTVNYHSTVGVVNVADRFFPDGRTSFELRQALAQHNAECKFFSVPLDIDPEVLQELSVCDRFILTGFVTPVWVQYLQSLNKPIVQIGTSDYAAPLCRVEIDWAGGMLAAVEAMSQAGCRKVMFLMPDPQYNAHATAMRLHFLKAMKHFHMPEDGDVAPLIPYRFGTGMIKDLLSNPVRRPDAVITIEPGGNLFPLLMAVGALARETMPYLVIMQQINMFSPDCEVEFDRLYNVLYDDSPAQVAVKILYEYPYKYIEECRVHRIPATIGHGRKQLPAPIPMPDRAE